MVDVLGDARLPPCVRIKCVDGYDCIKTFDKGTLETVPFPCQRVPGFTIVEYVARDVLEYSREDGFCVVYSPVKAVLPMEVCDYFDELMEGKVTSRVFLGPGGTGKTLTLEIIERTALFNVINVEPEMFLKPYVGQSEEELYKMLKRCEDTEPCLMVMDEGDILLRSRFAGQALGMAGTGTASVSEDMVRILLRRLQKWYNEKRLLGMAVASNLPASMIEKPLLRAGRLGEPIYFPIPDRRAILKLAELYGKKLTEEEISMFLRYGLPHSNIVEYFKTGKIKKMVPEAFAGLEYAEPAKRKRPWRLSVSARIVIAEKWSLGVKLAAIIASTEFNKPLLYLKDPRRLQDIDLLGRSMNLPIAIPYTPYTSDAPIMLHDYPNTVFYVGEEWSVPFLRLDFEMVVRFYTPITVSKAICGEAIPSASMLRQRLYECLSNIE